MTYKNIQVIVKNRHGFVPKSCWIAHILSDYGKTTRQSPNRIDINKRKYPCPDNKRPFIEKLLKEVGKI